MPRIPEDDQIYLDHVGHFVPDLDAAAAALESAGFVLTPRTRQRNLTAAGFVPSGTSNRCVMLREGYIEVLAATDDTPLARQLETALARYTGPHLVALAVADASRAHARLADNGFEPLAPVDLRRPVESADAAPGEARFTVLRVAPDRMPEGRIQMLRHHTPELVWQERWLAHGNGIVALAGSLLCVADPAEAAARFSRFSGTPFERRDERWILALDRGALCFVAPESLVRVAPFAETRTSVVPRVVATALTSVDTALTFERFGAGGVHATGRPAEGGQTSYAFPPSIGAFATVVPTGTVPDWLA